MNLAASSVSRAFSRDLTAAPDRDLVATAVSGVEGSFEELVRRYQALGIRDIEVIFYPGARHETLNETNRDEVTRDLLAFLERAVSARAAKAA